LSAVRSELEDVKKMKFDPVPTSLNDVLANFSDREAKVKIAYSGRTTGRLGCAGLVLNDGNGRELGVEGSYGLPPGKPFAMVTSGGRSFVIENRTQALAIDRLVARARENLPASAGNMYDRDFNAFYATNMTSSILSSIER
jgi:hypothetical protein